MINSEAFNIDLIILEDIVITQATIENTSELTSLSDDYSFDLTYGFKPGVSLQRSKARIIFTCEIQTKDGNDEKVPVHGRFDISFQFAVKNLNELVFKTEESLQVNSDLMTTLSNIAYSTSRGIIYTRCHGTILKKVILPILSNKKLIELLQPNSENS